MGSLRLVREKLAEQETGRSSERYSSRECYELVVLYSWNIIGLMADGCNDDAVGARFSLASDAESGYRKALGATEVLLQQDIIHK